MLHHIFFSSIVEVVWETRHMRIVRSIIPTLEQATCLILPMMAILRDTPLVLKYGGFLGYPHHRGG
jgi:hypothetical protein